MGSPLQGYRRSSADGASLNEPGELGHPDQPTVSDRTTAL
jgi:hypothetical protein